LGAGTSLPAAGLLTPIGQAQPLVLRDHQVAVQINGGYARTEWTQVFLNQSSQDCEAVYEVPLPEEATLAEVRIIQGDQMLTGEVVSKDEAERIYEQERAAGNDAGLAAKDGFQHHRFQIARIPAGSEARLEVVYYEPVNVDTGVGTYRYPLEEGGTDMAAAAFWTRESQLVGTFSVDITVDAGTPLAAVRVPGFEAGVVEVVDENCRRFSWAGTVDQLDRDLVLYYQLTEDLPGRVEVYAHKPDAKSAGTFMAVITPGLDLKPLLSGDYVFILDLSGSMQGKWHTLVEGVRESLQAFSPTNRFRIIIFNDRAQEWTNGWVNASPENVGKVIEALNQLRPSGSTNLYDGLALGVNSLDSDRASNVVLVTDAVVNTGETAPRKFRRLVEDYDLRLFAFVLGNSANWPLMDTLCQATGGYARGISNQQDIVGEILLAQSKMGFQSLRAAEINVGGSARPFDVSGLRPRKIFRGQQIVVMGRYAEGGALELRLDGKLTGEAKTYATTIVLPDVEPSRPELERLWALRQLREWADPLVEPAIPASELGDARRDLALQYQLVTDDTAMILLDDAQFAHHGIERRNAQRTARERAAAVTPAPRPATDTHQPMTPGTAPSFGGGAIDLGWVSLLVLGLGAAYQRGRRIF